MRTQTSRYRSSGIRALARAIAVGLLCAAAPAAAHAVATGRLSGRVLATDTGEPIPYADVSLVPADSSLRPVSAQSNADGTFLLEAAPGRYALRIRALSYTSRTVEGIVLEAGGVRSYSAALSPEAIQQEQIVVEARARQDTDASLLAARRKARAIGDAVSAEQVRRSPDKDAGEVMRRLTGLTVADGKYVFVRGLGERYSSTEVDGVRIASTEPNKRVVPLDLLPAGLLDNVVVQKTYTADRPGEFGGGDVQVHTKDFPGGRTWQLTLGQGVAQDVTFRQRSSDGGGAADAFGFGAGDRALPDGLGAAAGGPLVAGSPPYGSPRANLAQAARLFSDAWSPRSVRTLPNGAYGATYGDEWKVLGRSLGFIASASFARSFDRRDEAERLFAAGPDTTYDYAVRRSTDSARLGALSALSYRISPAHSVHLRGLFLNSADDEVRTYQGTDHNRTEATTGQWMQHRDTRLLYVQRAVLSATLEGRDEFPRLLGTSLDWKLTRSLARRRQPDRREVSYDQGFYDDGTGRLVEYWGLGSTGSREWGDLHEGGLGTSLDAAVPFHMPALGKGKVAMGVDHQAKDRWNLYRRFDFYANRNADPTAPPETLFDAASFSGGVGTGYVEESTLPQDNYHATSEVNAGYVSVDASLGPRARATLGVRVERGIQDVVTWDPLRGGALVAQGAYAKTDWLPTANLTLAASRAVNLRLAASRTLSRPDLNELSPSPSLEYVAGYRVAGNPNLHRATIDNYDVRVEAFPGLSEVLAAGFFYKRLKEPIEQSIQGAVPPLLVPLNSDHGRNLGLELEARASLGRAWTRLRRFSLNANAAVISSQVVLKPQLTPLSDQEHPLQGQAAYSVNAALAYATPRGDVNAAVLVDAVGRRLRTLGYLLPDVYDQPTATLDATFGFRAVRGLNVKLSAKNLTDPRIRQLQNGKEVSGYRLGRTVSAALSLAGGGHP